MTLSALLEIHPRLYRAIHSGHMSLRALRNRVGGYRRRIHGSHNSVVTSGALLRNVTIRVTGDHNRIEILPDARLSNLAIELNGARHRLRIESHVSIWSGAFRFYDSDGCIRIGERTTIYGAEFGVTERGGAIAVGADCLFAHGIEVRNGDSHSIVDLATQARINPARDVTIGDHVWIGGRALILKGVRIGTGSVIGAGSIVTRDVPENSLAAGAPARPIRTGIGWLRERT